MKNATLLKIASLFIFLLSAQFSFGQNIEYTIYSEDFEGQFGKGVDGDNLNDTTGVDWTIDITDANLEDQYDYFKVTNQQSGLQRFKARDLNGVAIWESPAIPIEDFENVRFSIKINASPSQEDGQTLTDFVKTQYSLDDGATWTQATTNGYLLEDFGTKWASQENLAGTNLKIRVLFQNDGNNDKYYIDDVFVRGFTNKNYYVNNITGDDNNSGLTTSTAFKTLEEAIDTVEDLDNESRVTIHVAAGTYEDDENLEIKKENIEIVGAGSTTIFKGPYSSSTNAPSGDKQFIKTIKASNTTISNLQIKDFGAKEKDGGAIKIKLETADGSTDGIQFFDVTFDNNKTNKREGGALYIDGENAVNVTFTRCTFSNNSSTVGEAKKAGALYIKKNANVLIKNSLFFGNSGKKGGVIFTKEGADLTIISSTFSDNFDIEPSAGKRGAIVLEKDDTNLTISDCIFSNTNIYDIAVEKNNPTISITNTIYQSIEPGIATLINSSQESNQSSIFTDASNNDYTLKLGSPAIDYTYNNGTSGAEEDDFNLVSRPQGLADDIGAYERLGSWTGNVDSDWGNSDNWDAPYAPKNTDSPVIPPTNNDPIISDDDGENNDGDVKIQYITIKSGATLTIQKGNSLEVEKDFTNNGNVTLNSDSNEFASIIVGGTATGNITYNKHVNYQAYEEWDLVGPPVLNQNMKTFAQTNTNNNSTSGAMAMGGDYYALGQYYTGWGSWGNYTTSTIPDANFPVAKGYQMATNAVGNNSSLEGQSLTFTGEIATTTQTINIQNQNGANGGYGRRWNLVANPFPSYLNGNTNAGAQNFIDINEGVIDSSYLAIYAWKADGTGWHTFNRLDTNNDDGTLFIAPGQAFFVAAASTDVAQIQFTPSMRTVTGGDDFISGAPVLLNYKLDLKLYNGSAERAKTKFHFQQGLTPGLNPGYDAGAYDQAAALSSRLPEDDQGVNFQLNAMSIEAAYNQTIPLVINQQEGQSFRVSISNNTLPEDVNVYLEDVLNGTLTSLKDQDFELVAQEDLSQDGRFYIRFTTQNLAVNDVLSPSSLTIFKLNTDAFVTIQGLTPEMGKTTATIYNMLGMKVREKALNNTAATQQISTQGLASGVYIINLKAGEQAISKKIIIQ